MWRWVDEEGQGEGSRQGEEVTDAVAQTSRIDRAEEFLVRNGMRYCGVGENPDGIEIVHRFTPGLYIRECRMKGDHIFISKIHKTEHPFVISAGHCSVYNDEDRSVLELRAPYTGITRPGARRILIVHEDTIWTTFHPTQLTDPVEIEREIIEQHENPLLALRALKETT